MRWEVPLKGLHSFLWEQFYKNTETGIHPKIRDTLEEIEVTYDLFFRTSVMWQAKLRIKKNPTLNKVTKK